MDDGVRDQVRAVFEDGHDGLLVLHGAPAPGRGALTGGYIRNAMLRAAFLAADEERPIGGGHLTRAARLELEAMGRIAF